MRTDSPSSYKTVVVPEVYDGPLYAACRMSACQVRWHLWQNGAERELADPYVAEWPVIGLRPIERAWREGAVRVDTGGVVYDVRPSTGTSDEQTSHPFQQPVHILTAWNPDCRPADLTTNVAAGKRLEQTVQNLGHSWLPASGYGTDLPWAERSIAVVDLDDDQAQELAEQFSQPAFLRWTAHHLAAIRTGTGDLIGEGTVSVTALDRRPCPMSDKPVEKVCRNPGGPWVSSAISYGSFWAGKRKTLLAALGCGVCHGGPADGIGTYAGVGPRFPPQPVRARHQQLRVGRTAAARTRRVTPARGRAAAETEASVRRAAVAVPADRHWAQCKHLRERPVHIGAAPAQRLQALVHAVDPLAGEQPEAPAEDLGGRPAVDR
ncbi:MAG: hypothetical protein QOE54_215 [Streptosporangiaceae bacterium]|nr:hypothetical protein [Streptosporangiaceae bacterium]